MEVTQEETKEGKVVILSETGGCCWKGGVRQILVTSENGEVVVAVLERSDESAQISVWDESHDECEGRGIQDFERACLRWVKENLVSSNQQLLVKTRPKGFLTRHQGPWVYGEAGQ